MIVKLYRPIVETKMISGDDHFFNREAIEITNAEDFTEIVKYDHVFCKYNNHRPPSKAELRDNPDKKGEILNIKIGFSNQENFEETQCLWIDIDNDDKRNDGKMGPVLPDDWADLSDIQKKLKGIKNAIYTSKSHNKDVVINGIKHKMPKFHIVLPLKDAIINPEDFTKLARMLKSLLLTELKNNIGDKAFAPRIVDTSVFEYGRQFFGSGPKVQVIWNDGGIYFDERDNTDLISIEINTQINDELDPADERKKGALVEKLRDGENVKKGEGRHNYIRELTLSIKTKYPMMSDADIEEIVKLRTNTWSDKMDKKDLEDFNEALQSGIQDATSYVIATKEEIENKMMEYDEKFAIVWWGSKKELFVLNVPEDRAEIINIADKKHEENASINDVVWMRKYDPKKLVERLSKTTYFDYWLQTRLSQELQIEFDPNNPPGLSDSNGNHVLNVWQGIETSPVEGDCDTILDFIYRIICNKSKDEYEFLMDILANKYQNPGTLIGIAIGLYSKNQGVGKGTFIWLLGQLFGERYVVNLIKTETVVNEFNNHTKHKLFMQLNEAMWAGSPADASFVKGLITTEHELITPKGIDSKKFKNFKTLIFDSNNDWFMPIERQDRRMFAIHCMENHNRVNDWGWFEQLREVFIDEKSAFAWELSMRNISDVQWSKIPFNEIKWKQILLGLDRLDEFIYECLSDQDPIKLDGEFVRNSFFSTVLECNKGSKYRDQYKSVRARNKHIVDIFGDLVANKQFNKMGRGLEFNDDLNLLQEAFVIYIKGLANIDMKNDMSVIFPGGIQMLPIDMGTPKGNRFSEWNERTKDL